MTSPMHGCALFPPPQYAAPLAAIRARFDPLHATRTVPHITLKQGFSGPAFDSAEEQALVAALTATVRPFSALQIELDRVDSFGSPEFGGVVYARVVASPQLWALSAAVVSAVSKLGYATSEFPAAHENELFFPHLTLAQGLTLHEVDAMLAALASWQPLQFCARVVGLGRCDGQGVWRTPFTFGLSSDSNGATCTDPPA